MSDFSDRPLVADSIVGTRSFRVDSLGRLTGVSHREVWKPGVNEAECHSSSEIWNPFFAFPTSVRYRMSGASLTAKPEPRPDPEVVEAHQVASLNCGCGFYAYTDHSANPYHDDDNVRGIVRGEGVATVGSRGFRAERAEIVALVSPHQAPRSSWRQFCLRMAHGWIVAASFPPVVGGLIFGIAAAATHATALAVLMFTVAAIGLVTTIATFMGAGIYEPTARTGIGRERWNLVRRNYPDVRVFPSIDAATRAFPLSAPSEPSPSDDDFWTRSAS